MDAWVGTSFENGGGHQGFVQSRVNGTQTAIRPSDQTLDPKRLATAQNESPASGGTGLDGSALVSRVSATRHGAKGDAAVHHAFDHRDRSGPVVFRVAPGLTEPGASVTRDA
jgi:hypothetical protein